VPNTNESPANSIRSLKTSDLPPEMRTKPFRMLGSRVLVRMIKPQSMASSANSKLILPPGSADQSSASPIGMVVCAGPMAHSSIEPGAFVLGTSQKGSELFREPRTDTSWRLFESADIQAIVYLNESEAPL